jgi:hypothetical protein
MKAQVRHHVLQIKVRKQWLRSCHLGGLIDAAL